MGGGQAVRRADRLKETLELEIVGGVLPPGTKLDEPSLTRRFGVSRTPVREVLHQLAAIGLVEMRKGRSPIVASLTAQDLVDGFEVLTELEGLCGRLAARRASAGDRGEIRRLHEIMAGAVTDNRVEDYYRFDVEFHDALHRAAHNSILEAELRGLRRRFAPYRRSHFLRRGRIDHSFAEHERIVAAIEAGDAEAAARATREHIGMNGAVLADFLHDLRHHNGIERAG